MLLGHRIVVHHRIHVAGGNQKSQPRLPQNRDALRVAPIGLADHAYLIVIRLEQTRDDGHAERGMVDVRVTAHEHEVAAVPTALLHIGAANRQECATRRQRSLGFRRIGRRRCGSAARNAHFARTVRTLRLVRSGRALQLDRAVRLLRSTTARVGINAFARTPILAQRVLGTLPPRLVSFALLP